jgi:hypothetical protein
MVTAFFIPRQSVMGLLVGVVFACGQVSGAQDLVDSALGAATVPIDVVDKTVVQPLNRVLFRPVVRTTRFIVSGPKNREPRKYGVLGFGGPINERHLATGANLRDDQKPAAYAGEQYVRNAGQMANRTVTVARHTRRRIGNAIQP